MQKSFSKWSQGYGKHGVIVLCMTVVSATKSNYFLYVNFLMGKPVESYFILANPVANSFGISLVIQFRKCRY